MKDHSMLIKSARVLRKKKYISKSLDNKQKIDKKVKRKTIFKQTLEEMRSCFYGKRIEDPIEIDSTKSENLNYEVLEFENYNKNKKFSFKCYEENHLKISSIYSNKTIPRTCDDDCSTDDEQISFAIEKLYSSLKTVASERKKIRFFRKSSK